MGILNFKKKKPGTIEDYFQKNFDISPEDFKKSKILNSKWVLHFFRIAVNADSIDSVEHLKDRFLNVAVGALTESDSVKVSKDTFVFKGSLKKSVAASFWEGDEENVMILRFGDHEDVKEPLTRVKSLKSLKWTSNYKFTPIQSVRGIPIIHNIEQKLVMMFNLSTIDQVMNFVFEDGKPIVVNNDGFQYLVYPLEKRMQLAKEYPKLDKALFGQSFEEFVNWIMDKKDDNPHMKKYCKKVESLLKKHKFEV